MAAQDYREENRQRVIDFFRAGAKNPDDLGRLGLEVEHLVIANDGEPFSYEPHGSHIGVRDVLAALDADYPTASYNAHRDLLGRVGPDGSVTLEPAAQLEISAAPYKRVAEVEQAYRHFRSVVDPILAADGAALHAHGYHTTRRAQELTLIPKRRYDFMNAYFAEIGSDGDRMMRASSSTQVSVDFSSEADAARKMRVSAALAPVLAAIADNTPIFEREANHVPIRRLQLWREVDNLRCGTVPHIFEDGFGFEAYADWLLQTPPIFVTRASADDPAGERLRPFFRVSAADAYADAPMTKEDVEHLISMFWPDVRLKHFVEVRPADSLPEPVAMGYVALVKGIFYSEASMHAIEDALGVDPVTASTRGAWPLATEDVDAAIKEVQAHGFDAQIYGSDLQKWEQLLFSLAEAALDTEEAAYLQPLVAYAADKPWWHVS